MKENKCRKESTDVRLMYDPHCPVCGFGPCHNLKSPDQSRCNVELQKNFMAYPRTCAECGLGPCKFKSD